jgi:hypothetical protein
MRERDVAQTGQRFRVIRCDIEGSLVRRCGLAFLLCRHQRARPRERRIGRARIETGRLVDRRRGLIGSPANPQ